MALHISAVVIIPSFCTRQFHDNACCDTAIFQNILKFPRKNDNLGSK